MEANGFDFDSYWKSWILSRFVSITERIAASNKGTDLGNDNNNSTLFNSTTESDELNWSLPSNKVPLYIKNICSMFLIFEVSLLFVFYFIFIDKLTNS